MSATWCSSICSGVARLEDQLSRHRPVRRARKRIEIRTAVNLTLARHDLRRHECGCAWQDSLCGQQTRLGSVGPILDDSEIQHLQVVVLVPETGHEEIGGFDVPVHKAVFMRLGEGTTRLTQEHDDALGWLRSEAFHHAVEIQTFKQLHDVIEISAVGDSEIVELHRMRRAQDWRLSAPHARIAARAVRVSRRADRSVESASRPPDAPGAGVGHARPRPCRRSPVVP